REGRVFKLLADLDPKGRMARLLVRVQDPFVLKGQDAVAGEEGRKKEKILLDSYVKVEIDAGVLDGVYVIPREALREGDRLWLVNDEGLLDIREVKVLWRRVNEVLVDMQLAADERIVVSRLQSAIPGMVLRDDSRPSDLQQDGKE
ncbi:MAG: hypothetical protein KKE53_03535, partial [Proteobacteria bacterium]|nr:hypothetical protein [Pseudomonadota bacterium]